MTLPDVIILYGAPASGKGTQADNLKQYLHRYNYTHFDFGGELRKFVTLHLGKYKDLSETEITSFPNPDNNLDITNAIEAGTKMLRGEVVAPDTVWYIMSKQIADALESGERLIVEGLGRTFEDARRFGKIAKSKKLKVCIFHLCITMQESVKRSVTRFYVNGHSKPYSSLKDALENCTNGEKPWQRPEDLDSNTVARRYNNMYAEIYAKVLSILQMDCKADLFIIDGRDSIEDDFKRIREYLLTFYQINE